jgi:hypothetical protein
MYRIWGSQYGYYGNFCLLRINKKSTDISEEHFTSVFRVEEQAKKKPAWIANCYALFSSLAYSSTLNMEVTYSSETLVDLQRYMFYIPEEENLQVGYKWFKIRCCAINSFLAVAITFWRWHDLHTEFRNNTALKWKATRNRRTNLETCGRGETK